MLRSGANATPRDGGLSDGNLKARRSRSARARPGYIRACATSWMPALTVTPRRKSFHPAMAASCRPIRDGVDTFLWRRPACEARPCTINSLHRLPCAPSSAAARAEGGSSTKTASCGALRFENLREDSLPISSSEVQRKTRRCAAAFPMLQAAARKAPERFASCQGSRAIRFATFQSERHFGECPVE